MYIVADLARDKIWQYESLDDVERQIQVRVDEGDPIEWFLAFDSQDGIPITLE
jgi:hypothetical protein